MSDAMLRRVAALIEAATRHDGVLALTRAAKQGIVTQDEATLIASLRPAADAAIRWHDRLLAEAMKELAGHPLRRNLLDAAMALAPAAHAPATTGIQHAA